MYYKTHTHTIRHGTIRHDLKLRDLDGAAHVEGWSGRQSVSFVRVINIKVLIWLRYEQRYQRKQAVITTRQVPRYYCPVLLILTSTYTYTIIT